MTDLLDNLADSTEQIRSHSSEVLKVLCTPGFAARWLLPRLPRFRHSEAVRLRIADGAPSTDFNSNDADVVIKWRDDPQDGVAVWPFLTSARTPVAAPGFAGRHCIVHPKDLLGVTLFRDQTDDMWPKWFEAAGVVGTASAEGPHYPNCEYATTAAEAGLGVALAYDAVIRDTLSEGRLVRLFEPETPPFTIYAIACDGRRSDDKVISAFRDWLLAETRADGTLPDMASVETVSMH
ncbi:LysR substrate-binding domain-containing protein [Amaricoccus tamworthensis]|uniref:LysR substrate-binding domain-containing protein n=1 Tax=Amaricoccus tamworthensis TaxID=57002 RepID=UPI003C7C1C55